MHSGLVALAAACSLAAAAFAASAQNYAKPRFADPDREKKIRAVLPAIDQVFADFAAERRTPGLVWGVVLDGRLIHTGTTGFANLETKTPAAVDTRFRIASMTKSFTALAIMKLRDEDKLGLDENVVRYVPELGETAPLTEDAPPLTIRRLLTMTGGYPQDDPWADRLLAQGPYEFEAFVRGGVTASNAPGIGYEYSNFGYALLGQIVTDVAHEPYQRYITREILEPLGMKDTKWEFEEVPAAKLALGYRWENNAWRPEPLLHDGVYGAMGGLITTLPDFAKYVAFHLAAWPARNDPDEGPVHRATLRAMHQVAIVSGVTTEPKTLAGEPDPQAHGYAFGLRWSMDSRRAIRVGHSGGLPGFGSNWQCLPDYGVAIISFANLTYAGTTAANNKAISLLLEKAGLKPRVIPPSEILERRRQQIVGLIVSWDEQLAADIVADNFFLDRSRELRMAAARDTLAKLGPTWHAGPIAPENQLRGTFPLLGRDGRVDVYFTLTPERIPRVQELRLTFVPATAPSGR